MEKTTSRFPFTTLPVEGTGPRSLTTEQTSMLRSLSAAPTKENSVGAMIQNLRAPADAEVLLDTEMTTFYLYLNCLHSSDIIEGLQS